MTRPRRRPREGTVHQRPNGTWCGQINLGMGLEGQRRRKTVYGHSEAEVLRKMADARRQLAEHGDLSTSDTPLHRWLEYWLTDIAANRLKPNTWRSYRTAINQHIVPSIGNIRLGKLQPQHLRKMHNDLIARGRSVTTAHNAHRILSAALKDAKLEGRVSHNIAHDTSPPGRAESDRTGMSAQTAKVVLRAADGPLAGRWLLALLYGMRQGERLGLRWSHVDFDANLIDLSWSLTRVSWAHGCGEKEPEHTARSCPSRRLPIPPGMKHVALERNYVLMTPKTRASVRVVPMLPPVRVMLERRRDTGTASPHGLVWCDDNGGPIDPRDDWADWHALLKAAGVPRVTLHEARNTAATLLLEAGVDVKIIGTILGHSQIVTTRSYQTVSTELAQRALEAIAQRLELD